jgi:hypothetical protein
MGICSSLWSPKLTTVVQWCSNLMIVMAREDAELHFHAIHTMTEPNCSCCVKGGTVVLENCIAVRKYLDHGSHLITQPVHAFPCSNSTMKDNNGTNRIQYHDIATQTITEPPPCFTVWNQAFRIVGFLAYSQNVKLSWCREQREGRLIWPYHAHFSSYRIPTFYGRDTIVYASEHDFQ